MPLRRQRSRMAQYPSPNRPVPIRANLEHTHRFRFTSLTNVAINIKDTTFILACGVSASTAVLGNAIRQSVKVNQVEIWAPPASQGAAVTCSVLWPQSQRSQAREVSDTSVSVASPAHVKCGPPAESLASFWTDGTSGSTFFTLVAPLGSIVDVVMSMVDADGEADAVPVSPATLVGATVGAVYYCGLDSGTKAAAQFIPVSLTSL